MSMTSKRSRIAGNYDRSHHKRSVPSGKATTPPAAKRAADALVEAMRESGGDVSAAVHFAEVMLGLADKRLDRYVRLVADDGPKARDAIVGKTDMDVTATVARIASTSVAMLGRLLDGREARAMAVGDDDCALLAKAAERVAKTHAHALKDCTEAIERLSA